MKFHSFILFLCMSGILAQDAGTVTDLPATVATDAPEAVTVATDAPAVVTDAPVDATDALVVTDAPAAEAAAAAASADAPAAEAAPAVVDTTTVPSDETTTLAPPTPSPTPSPDKYFRVTENKVTCIMFAGDVKFAVSFPTESGEKGQAVVSVPTPANESVTVTGSCQDSPQYISIGWGPTNTRSSFKLAFNSTGDKWELISTEAEIYLDEDTFKNTTDAGKTLLVHGAYAGLSFIKVDTNSSFVCRAAVDSKNFTATFADVPANATSQYSVSSSAVGFSTQAYNSIPNDTQLQEGSRCEADVTSDLVPIAVGCALAGLVVLVLISYLVGRRRRSAAYQSV